MKKILLYIAQTLVLAGAWNAATAQDIDRTKAPKPGPAPVINIGEPATFTLPNGLRVFVVTNSKLPQVSATLTIDRESLYEGEKAGVTSMAGSMMRRGTTTMSKSELDEAIDFLGGTIGSSAVSVFGNSLKGNFPRLMKLMADVALRPAFAQDELEKVRRQTLSGLASAKDDPNSIASKVSSMLVYGKSHPYGEFETEKTVQAISVADVKAYHNTWWKPNIAYLVFVGDITADEAKKLATENFGSWARANVPKLTYAGVQPPAKTYIAVVDRPNAVQSIINISAPANLRPGAPDAIATSVMSTLLGGGFSSRLNQNLREKYAFTYGARGGVSTDRLVGRFSAGASVRNEKTDSAIGQFLYEMKRLREQPATDEELSANKNYMSGGFARSLEDPGTIAGFALNQAIYNLPKDYYRNYLTKLASVQSADVKASASKYIPVDNLIITVVGNAKEIAPGLEKYGEVKYFDTDGNPVAAPVVKKVEGNLKAEDVLRKAIDAYGGAAAIAAIKDISMEGEVSIMGQSLNYVQKNVMPDGFSTSVLMSGMAVMQQSKKGTAYSSSMQGQNMEVGEADKEDLDLRAAFIEERLYLSNPAYKTELKGIEQVDGKDAYHLQLTKPSGAISQLYYDVATGLKVQESSEKEMGPMGKATLVTKYQEYATHGGVKVPVKMVVDAGAFKQDINIKTVKVNQGLKVSDL